MKAVLLRGYGGVDQLHYEDMPAPVAQPGEVLVKVISASFNPLDSKLRSGAMKSIMPLEFPFVLGSDVAGEVSAIGSGVTEFKIGDLVMGFVSHSYAEYLAAKASALAKIPDGLDPADAGALPVITLTGAQLIEKGVQPKSGEVVLITGALGSVGRTAVFVAKQLGATVIAGVRAKQKAEAQSIGADSVLGIDDDSEISGMPELDAVADTVNGETIAKLIPKLKKSGRLATVVGKPAAAEKAGVKVNEVYAQPDADRLYRLAQDVLAGRLQIPISERFHLADIRDAHTFAEKGSSGKIVLRP